MELISTDGQTVLKGLDTASVEAFAQNEALLVFMSSALGDKGSARLQELQAKFIVFFENRSQSELDVFLAMFTEAYQRHLTNLASAKKAQQQGQRRSDIKRALIFWVPVITAIALYFFVKH